MPNVVAAPRNVGNGQVLRHFVDSVGTTSVTYTFPTAQEFLVIRNIGDKAITATVGATNQVIQPGGSWKHVAEFTDFSIVSSVGVQAFEATGDEKGSTFESPEGIYFTGAGAGGSPSPTGATLGNTIIGIGDSITVGNGSFTGGFAQSFKQGDTSWFSHACVLSGGQLKPMGNAGVSGETTTQVLARLQSEVISKGPKMCAILAGTNDINQGLTLATTLANIESMITQLTAAGITPILCTIPPRNTANATQKTNTYKINMVIQMLGQKYKLNVVDFYSSLVNPVDGQWAVAANNSDGVHPTATGSKVMGQLFVDKITPLLPSLKPFLPGYDNDGVNGILGGLFMTDTNADGLGDNWTKSGTGTATTALVTDANILGKWQELNKTVNDTNAVTITSNSIAVNGSAFTAGHKILVCARVQTSGIESGVSAFDFRLNWVAAGSGPFLMTAWTKDVTNGLIYQEITIPNPCTSMSIGLTIKQGTGIVRIAQVGIFNLTAMGFN